VERTRPIPIDLYSRLAGQVLRDVRRRKGLTLRDVGERSAGTFKPTSVAGYERGERAISLQRFCELAEFYGAQADRLLAEVLRRHRGEADVVVDLPALERLEGREAKTVAAFVEEVRALRGDTASDVRLRIGDLQVLSTGLGRREVDLLGSIRSSLAAQHASPTSPVR
jgi:transcriptional regulator with XRE-family HTH domain